MNADEIVKALHWSGDALARQPTDYPTGGDTCYTAADLIEALEARADQCGLNYQQKCRDVAELEIQLAAKGAEIARLTANREAMLNQLRRADLDCDLCKHNIAEDCGNPEFDCETCHLDCACKGCINNSKWEWRGAGEG